MKLTVKNICAELLKEENSICPFCGADAEICALGGKKQYEVRIVCNDCGARIDFRDWLIKLERGEEMGK
ncbi:Lar family restriction alleviation protein [Acetonema longum]|uniref:Uncharacterized protein n=1 Tax=Acetonema longum DSM 6540 TaxID=1009370 RepID=F7NKC0_9FIRM|nr:Lar family restriction alleviation protein [Acetonema longum]EGO63561.1 hypothetical protein ALO_12666 [Acetonema longum DSM 6540]